MAGLNRVIGDAFLHSVPFQDRETSSSVAYAVYDLARAMMGGGAIDLSSGAWRARFSRAARAVLLIPMTTKACKSNGEK